MLGYGLYTISSVNYAELVVGRENPSVPRPIWGPPVRWAHCLPLPQGGFLCQYLGVQAMVMVSLAAALTGGLVILFTAGKDKALKPPNKNSPSGQPRWGISVSSIALQDAASQCDAQHDLLGLTV